MPLIEWSNKYSIGIDSIDEQHKELIALINKLNIAMAHGEAASVVASIFEGLANYTKVHFAYEEALFKKHGYPQSTEHLKEHQQLIKRVEQFKFEFEQDLSGAVSLELIQFMTHWLLDHILKSDRDYSPFLIKCGVK